MRKRKVWDGKWVNTMTGRRELLVQFTTLLAELAELRERVRFMQAITQKAVVELARRHKPE